MLVNESQVEVSDQPEEGWEYLGELVWVLKFGATRIRLFELDLLRQVDDEVELREALLVDRIHTIIDELAAEKDAQCHDSQVVVLAFVERVEAFGIDHDGCGMLTVNSLAIGDRTRVDPETLYINIVMVLKSCD